MSVSFRGARKFTMSPSSIQIFRINLLYLQEYAFALNSSKWFMRELCKINSTWGIDVIGRLLKKKTFLEIKMPVRECLNFKGLLDDACSERIYVKDSTALIDQIL